MHYLAIVFFWLFFVFIQSVKAVPSYIDLYKATHQESMPNCTLCHSLTPGALPSNENVSNRGRELYIELKKQSEQYNIINAGKTFSEPPDFVVFGDTRTNDSVHKEIVQAICNENPSAVFHTGDIVATGSNMGQWQTALKIQQCLIKPKILYPTCGNHEGDYCLDNPLKEALGIREPFYLKEHKGFTFIALDSEDQSSEQLRWLRNLPVGKRYIPFYHHVPYPTISGHGADSEIVKTFVPEFKRLGVKIAFNGHNHGYDRALVDGIQYVTVGGGGAPLYPCGPKKSYTKACLSDYGYLKCKISKRRGLYCVSLKKNGEVVDTFTVDYP